MLDYASTIRLGAAAYADALSLLRARGLTAELTQTGGMCAALLVRLEGGAVLLITDAEDDLAWNREDHHGWGVGLYRGDDYGEGPVLFASTNEGQVDALPPLIEKTLRAARGALADPGRSA